MTSVTILLYIQRYGADDPHLKASNHLIESAIASSLTQHVLMKVTNALHHKLSYQRLQDFRLLPATFLGLDPAHLQ